MKATQNLPAIDSHIGHTKRSWVVSCLAALFLSFSLLIAPQAAAPAHATGQLDTFCSNSWGTTVWTGRDPYACDGTLAGYIDGQFQGSVNIVRLIADNPPRTELDLNAWCGSQPFYCAVVVGGFWWLMSMVTQ